MATADDETVLGDFSAAGFDYRGTTSMFSETDRGFVVRTDGASGELRDFTVRYTFGVYPLQQYLLEGADGRLQALGIAWDAREVERGGQRWYHLYPDEKVNHDHVLHWTALAQHGISCVQIVIRRRCAKTTTARPCPTTPVLPSCRSGVKPVMARAVSM